MEPVLRVRELTYRYPDSTLALDHVDFDLYRGERVALLGPNGSGKTTFTLCLNGLLEGEGAVTFMGETVSGKGRQRARRKIGMVFQDADDQLILPTVIQDVMFGLRNAGVTGPECRVRAEAALAAVGLSALAERAPWHLSAGEKRRAAIAGVLVMNPEILILDEPTTSLDPPGRKDLIGLLETLPQARIIVTHDAGLARAAATRAVFFQQGRIAGDGTVDEILRRFRWAE